MKRLFQLRPSRHARGGITLIECAGASLILGLMITAGLRASVQAGASQVVSSRSLAGTLLAEALLNEISMLAYAEPSGAITLGPDAGETGKATFDDIDDYDNWTESPITDSTAVAISGMSKWSRSVRVYRALVSSPDTNSAAETGLKRIEVTVKFSDRVVAKLSALRSVDP